MTMKVTVQATFNKQTKDSKKELMQFYVQGADENKPELDTLCREVVELHIEGVDATLTAEYAKKTKDAKKTVLEFVIKGDTSADKSFEFYRMAGSTVTLTIIESQMSIDEFNYDNYDDGDMDEDMGDYPNHVTLFDDVAEDEEQAFDDEDEDELLQ